MSNPWDDDPEPTSDGRPTPIDDQHYVAGDGSGGWQQRWKGDGLAVVAPNWMNFTNEKVPVPPSDLVGFMPTEEWWRTRVHHREP